MHKKFIQRSLYYFLPRNNLFGFPEKFDFWPFNRIEVKNADSLYFSKIYHYWKNKKKIENINM